VQPVKILWPLEVLVLTCLLVFKVGRGGIDLLVQSAMADVSIDFNGMQSTGRGKFYTHAVGSLWAFVD